MAKPGKGVGRAIGKWGYKYIGWVGKASLKG